MIKNTDHAAWFADPFPTEALPDCGFSTPKVWRKRRPIVAVTGCAHDDAREKARQAGFDHH